MKLMTRNGGRRNLKKREYSKRETRLVNRVLEIEALETRLLLSGVGTGLNLKKVTFTDADGDRVTIKISGSKQASFDIKLLGGATNGAPIESLVVRGNNAALEVSVRPVKFSNGVRGVTPPIYSDGLINIGEIVAAAGTNTLRGIALSGAVVSNINLPDVTVGSIGLNLGRVPVIDRIMTTVAGSFPVYVPRAPEIDFHNVTVGAVTGGITLIGFEGNDFLGPITATSGAINSIIGVNAALTSTVLATQINNIKVFAAGGADIATTTGDLTLDVGNGGIGIPASVVSGGNLNLSVSGGGLTGTFIAAGHINLGVGGGGIFDALIQAGNGISGANRASNSDAIRVIGAQFTGIEDTTFQALSGSIADITVVGRGGIEDSSIIATAGNIGVLTADNFDNVFVNAGGSIAGLNARTATAQVALSGQFFAGTTIGAIDVQNDRQAGVGIDNALIRAEQGFAGPINVRVTGGPDAVAIDDASFSTGGNFTGAITVISSGGVAIDDAIFSARGGFAPISVTGDVRDSLFVAGYDVGRNGKFDGPAPNTDDRLGDPNNAALAPIFAGVTISGNLTDSVFAAGVNPVNGVFGDTVGAFPLLFPNDVLNDARGAINNLTVSGTTRNTVIEAAILGAISQNQQFQGNTVVFYGTGTMADITIVGAFNGVSAFADNVIIAPSGNIGNILVHNTTEGGVHGISDSVIVSIKGTVGDIVGITAGNGGSGINNLQVYGAEGVGNIIGIATNAGDPGLHGINGLDAVSDRDIATAALSSAAQSFLGAAKITLPANTTPGVLGWTVGVGSGIRDSKLRADFDHDAVGSIGNITGIADNERNVDEAYGITGLQAFAGANIGNITGTVNSRGLSAGINGSEFAANANAFATPSGVGAIGNIVGTAASTDATGNHTGIRASAFRAGTHPVGGQGTIGAVSATAVATGAEDAVTAIAIDGSAFLAGVGPAGGAIGTFSITAEAKSAGAVNVRGIVETDIIVTQAAAGGLGGSGVIDIGAINVVATSTGADATAVGIEDSFFRAGLGTNGKGQINALNVTATAITANGKAFAEGIADSQFVAADGDNSVGVIQNVTASAVAKTAAGNATARGITGTDFFAANGVGTGTGQVGNISGTAEAEATGNALALGLTNVEVIAGSGNSTSAVGNLSGAATATAKGAADVKAQAEGVTAVEVTIIGSTATIGDITGSGVASASTGGTGSDATAEARGIRDSQFTAGAAAGAVGTIGAISGTATATADSATGDAEALAWGIDPSQFNAGGDAGTIGLAGITGKATATATGASALAEGGGIAEVEINAANNGTKGQVGPITGDVTITALATGDNQDAEATGWGLHRGVIVNAGNAAGGVGTVADITGIARVKVEATGKDGVADAFGRGIAKLEVTAGNLGTGTIGNVTGNVAELFAKSANGDAYVEGYGIRNSTLSAGAGAATGTGVIGNVTGLIGTSATPAVATAPNGIADGYLEGLSGGPNGVKVIAGGANGTIGNVVGRGFLETTGAMADADVLGITGVEIRAADKGTAGVIGSTTAEAVAKATATGSKANQTATANADGIFGLQLLAGNGNAAGSTGTVGDVNSTATLSATATGKDETNTAGVSGRGIDVLTIRAGVGAEGTGTVGNITGTVVSATASSAANSAAKVVLTADVLATGIENLDVQSGAGSNNATGTVGIISGIVTLAKATATGDGEAKVEARGLAGGLNGSVVRAGGLSGTVAGVIGTVGEAAATGLNATGNAVGINDVKVTVLSHGALGEIGDVTGTAKVTAVAVGTGQTTAGTKYDPTATANGVGIDQVDLNAGLDAKAGTTGKIGNITGVATVTAEATGTLVAGQDNFATAAGTGVGNVAARAGHATGNSGTVGNVTGTATVTSKADATAAGSTATSTGVGLDTVVVSAGDKAGSIGNVTGNVTASATGKINNNGVAQNGVKDSTLRTGGTIGNLNVLGDVLNAQFLAGILNDGVTGVTGGQIGNVVVSGRFLTSDLIASVTRTNGVWGDADDVMVGTSKIGTISIGAGVTPVAAAVAGADSNNAIQANTIGAITIGTNAPIAGGTGPGAVDVIVDSDLDNAITATDVRVRTL